MNEIVRENFRRFRRKTNISQEQMAEYLDLEQSSISKFENGERSLSMSNLEKACALFGIKTSDIFKGESSVDNLSPAFRKTNLSTASLDDLSNINRIALNILEMRAILEKRHG